MNSIRLPEGIHAGVSEAAYHADPAETPSASASILRTMYDRSPLHAFTAHPRLNPNYVNDPSTEAQDAGTILHALVLGSPEPFRVLDFVDFRADAAKKARNEARDAGLIPILAHKIADLRPIAKALQDTLARDFPEVWTAMMDPDAIEEATLIWREGQTLCRCRFDVLPPAKYRATYDLKFTGLSAEPGEWSRKLLNDYLIQSSFYPRAVKALRGDEPEFRFIVCETEPPYAVSIHAASPEVMEIGARRVDAALARWLECLSTGWWPSYTPLIHYTTAPSWWAAKDDERAIQDQIASDLMEKSDVV